MLFGVHNQVMPFLLGTAETARGIALGRKERNDRNGGDMDDNGIGGRSGRYTG